jgi:hypothetical protein
LSGSCALGILEVGTLASPNIDMANVNGSSNKTLTATSIRRIYTGPLHFRVVKRNFTLDKQKNQ